jgi:hypothetical protein
MRCRSETPGILVFGAFHQAQKRAVGSGVRALASHAGRLTRNAQVVTPIDELRLELLSAPS